MSSYDLLAPSLELSSHLCPGVPLLDQPSSRSAQGPAPFRSPKQPDDVVRKVTGIISLQEVLSGSEGKPFGADRGRDDRLAHRQRLEDLQSRPSADPQRDDEDGGFVNKWSYVVDGPRDADTRRSRPGPQTRSRIASCNGQ